MPIEIDPRRTAVVVIDMQNDVVHPDGVWGGPSGAAAHCAEQDAIANIGQITDAARRAGSRVFFVHHLPSVGAADDADSKQNAGLWRDTRETGGLSSEWGRAPVDGCAPQDGDTVLHKQRGNAFTSTSLDVKLRGLGVEQGDPARRVDEHGGRVDRPGGRRHRLRDGDRLGRHRLHQRRVAARRTVVRCHRVRRDPDDCRGALGVWSLTA